MGKYQQDAQQLLELVGGKQNIAAVSHCITRMRFVLVDTAKADINGIEAMKVVKGSFTQSGQFQVIIGNTVADSSFQQLLINFQVFSSSNTHLHRNHLDFCAFYAIFLSLRPTSLAVQKRLRHWFPDSLSHNPAASFQNHRV